MECFPLGEGLDGRRYDRSAGGFRYRREMVQDAAG